MLSIDLHVNAHELNIALVACVFTAGVIWLCSRVGVPAEFVCLVLIYAVLIAAVVWLCACAVTRLRAAFAPSVTAAARRREEWASLAPSPGIKDRGRTAVFDPSS